MNDSEGNIVANLDADRTAHAGSNGLGSAEPDDLVWAAAIAQVWAADFAD